MTTRLVTTRVVATADLHGHTPAIPPCDVALIAGDVCPVSDHRAGFQRRWLETVFAPWLESLDADAVVGIAGNHDFVAQADPALMRSLPWTYLEDETSVVAGLKVHGSTWTPTFNEWAFMRDEPDLVPVWARIPDDVDVLLTHGPPFEHGDLVVDGSRHAGSRTLGARLAELGRLRLHVFGHIHEGGGYRGRLGGATLANVSYVDLHYRPAQPPVVFEV
jgi:Icc-related predicted phosphoesterase